MLIGAETNILNLNMTNFKNPTSTSWGLLRIEIRDA